MATTAATSDRTYPPWIGRKYSSGGMFGKRIFILGESSYPWGDLDELPNDTNILIAQDHIDGYRDAFRTKLVRVFLNTDTESREQIEEFWQSVAFMNFIKKGLSGPRIAPTNAMWTESGHDLGAVLTANRPALLLVLGYRMWDQWAASPPLPFEAGPTVAGAGKPLTRCFDVADGAHRVLAYGMKHPSAGFSWRSEHPALARAIALA